MGKQPLKRFTIAITGDFGEQRSPEQIRKWIHVNGGTVAYDVSGEVTHLVCSKKHFKDNVAMVQKARRLRSVKIVSWDWLEDSLLKERPMKEIDYLLAPLVKCAKETKQRKKAVRQENIEKGMAKFEQGCKEFKEDMFSDGYHIYQDSTSFTYDITLARTNLLINKNDRFALKVCHPPSSSSSIINTHPPITNVYTPPHRRHLPPPPPPPRPLTHQTQTQTPTIITTPLFPIVPLRPRSRARLRRPRAQRLQLYESHTTPKYYACYAKYSSPSNPSITNNNTNTNTNNNNNNNNDNNENSENKARSGEMLAPTGSSWETAWGAFSTFFRLKTGMGWEERFVVRRGMGAGMGVGGGKEKFRYTPPKVGRPRGVGAEA